jgi:hypothetical protein
LVIPKRIYVQSCYAFWAEFNEINAVRMSGKTNRNKGGRPRKEIKKDQILAIKCTMLERKIITGKARLANLSVSEFIREFVLKGKIDNRNKVLPKEILGLTGQINHIAANLNQIAKKRNSIDELTVLERAELNVQSRSLKELATEIKEYLK